MLGLWSSLEWLSFGILNVEASVQPHLITHCFTPQTDCVTVSGDDVVLVSSHVVQEGFNFCFTSNRSPISLVKQRSLHSDEELSSLAGEFQKETFFIMLSLPMLSPESVKTCCSPTVINGRYPRSHVTNVIFAADQQSKALRIMLSPEQPHHNPSDDLALCCSSTSLGYGPSGQNRDPRTTKRMWVLASLCIFLVINSWAELVSGKSYS